MIYYSKVTAEGNSSYSYDSQENAEAKAKYLDEHGCSDCSDCSRCSRCSYCSGCSDCSDCSRCSDCSDCSGCSYCSGCSDCSDCSRCSDCSDCSGCSDCSRCSGITDGSKGVIQAGRPDGWDCQGWLKNGKLIIHCGCRRKTFAEAVEYWSGKKDRQEVLIACHYIASVAVVKGWRTE